MLAEWKGLIEARSKICPKRDFAGDEVAGAKVIVKVLVDKGFHNIEGATAYSVHAVETCK